MVKEELIQSIIENMARCQRPGLNSSWKELGLSHAQVSMLYLVAYHKQASVKQVAEYLGITKSAVSQLMDPLAQKGYVSRQPDAADRRIIRLSLTSQGRSLLTKLAKHKFAGLRSALETLNPGELDALHKIYTKMATAITTERTA